MDPAAHYDVSWWDHDTQGWHRFRAGVRKWTLRRVIRELYRRAWSRVSIMVERVN